MANLESSFRTFLTQQSGITDLVTQRIYWNTLPDAVITPFLLLRASDIPSYTQQGESVGRFRVQVDAMAETDSDCYALRDAVRQAVSGYVGAMGEYRTRCMVQLVEGNFSPDTRLFLRILEVEIGYVK